MDGLVMSMITIPKVMITLEKELETYNKELPHLLSHDNKYVVICDTQIVGFFDTYEDATQVGYIKFKLEPFLVKRVEAMEQIQRVF